MVCNVATDRDTIKRLEEAGADSVTVGLPRDAGEDVLSELERIAERVLT